MKRSCQRHTQVFDLPVRRMISLVPTPSALNRTISARQTCLCGVLRSRASAFRRRRSAGLRVMEIPVRMRQTRMHPVSWESPPGFKCQTRSTRLYYCVTNWLKYLKYLVDRPARKSMARGHGDYIVEPSVFFRGGLKERHDAKIIIGRIDVLTPGNAIEHRLRPMPDALVSHSDKLLVISLQNKADVERSAN